jgi:hypothetical protein
VRVAVSRYSSIQSGLDARAAPGRRLGLGDILVVLGRHLGAVQALLKDGLGLVDLELGLEVLRVAGDAAAVGAAAGVGKVEGFVDDFLAGVAPGVGVSFGGDGR